MIHQLLLDTEKQQQQPKKIQSTITITDTIHQNWKFDWRLNDQIGQFIEMEYILLLPKFA